MLQKLWDKFIKLSTIIQFSAAKASIFISGTTCATALSIKFQWLSWTNAILLVAIVGLTGTALIYFSGWVWKEAKYSQHLSDVHPKMDKILERLDEIEKKIDEVNEDDTIRNFSGKRLRE